MSYSMRRDQQDQIRRQRGGEASKKQRVERDDIDWERSWDTISAYWNELNAEQENR